MGCSTPGLPLPKCVQFHVHCIIDIVQPPHPLTLSAPSAFNPSQNWALFQWVGCLNQVTKILGLQLQHQSFQWIFRVDFPVDWLVWLPCCPRDSQESSTPQCEGINSLVFCLLYSLVTNLECVEKPRHYSANKGPYNQGYGIPSGHLELWDLDSIYIDVYMFKYTLL